MHQSGYIQSTWIYPPPSNSRNLMVKKESPTQNASIQVEIFKWILLLGGGHGGDPKINILSYGEDSKANGQLHFAAPC